MHKFSSLKQETAIIISHNFNFTIMFLKTIGDDKPMLASDAIYFHLEVFFLYLSKGVK